MPYRGLGIGLLPWRSRWTSASRGRFTRRTVDGEGGGLLVDGAQAPRTLAPACRVEQAGWGELRWKRRPGWGGRGGGGAGRSPARRDPAGGGLLRAPRDENRAAVLQVAVAVPTRKSR
jgi:hypothetical protein